jgi:DUF2958 family protein
MDLLTKEIEARLRANGRRHAEALEHGENPVTDVVCKFFDPVGAGVWLVCELEEDGDTLWAIVDLGMDCVEFGTVSLAELREHRLMGLGIERDRGWTPQKTFAEYLAMDRLTGKV